MSVVVTQSKNEDRYNGDRLRQPSSGGGRRLHVIFVINLISSALILSSTCGSALVTAQHVVLKAPILAPSAPTRIPQPISPTVQLGHKPLLTKPLGSLEPDQEAYVFTTSFDTERDAIEKLVRQWAPLVWLAPGEKFMPSSVTDFLHHVHAEKSKSPAKNRPLSGNESEDVEDDNDGDRDNEHELYLLHQHQQQLSEKLTAQLLRQRQQKLRPANRRNADTETTESGVNANPWERRNKRTYHDENLLMDYIIDMPVGENSENWNLVTNDDIDSLLERTSSFIYGQSPAATSQSVPIYAMINTCPNEEDVPSHPTYSEIDQSDNKVNNNVEYKHNPYIPTNMNYFTSQDALPIKNYNSQEATKLPDQFGAAGTVATLNPVGNDLELGQSRKKREAVQVVMAESVQDYNGILDINDLYNKNFTDVTTESREPKNNTDDMSSSGAEPVQKSEPGPIREWSAPLESNDENLDWTPNNNYINVPPTPLPQSQYTKLVVPNYDFQAFKLSIDSHKKKLEQDKTSYPHFHVTYWLFFPYSQGKSMCSISLGPLGRVPIPLIFGVCLGTRKDFGSHVGDWEHMSLFFRGRQEPDAMYVSAHDAGAYYEYDRLTGTFEFRTQETRVGILQKPVFPRTVLTSNKHPVLFAAKGSHGLWTAPGKHKFVRVPRLYDINGFGVPWNTWQNTEIIYTNDITSRSFKRHWIQFQGRWGNSKTKCHPLKRIGLHFCEFSDGPKGITNRRAHFQCGGDGGEDTVQR